MEHLIPIDLLRRSYYNIARAIYSYHHLRYPLSCEFPYISWIQAAEIIWFCEGRFVWSNWYSSGLDLQCPSIYERIALHGGIWNLLGTVPSSINFLPIPFRVGPFHALFLLLEVQELEQVYVSNVVITLLAGSRHHLTFHRRVRLIQTVVHRFLHHTVPFSWVHLATLHVDIRVRKLHRFYHMGHLTGRIAR